MVQTGQSQELQRSQTEAAVREQALRDELTVVRQAQRGLLQQLEAVQARARDLESMVHIAEEKAV